MTLSARLENTQEDTWIVLEVRDTGVGIPDGDLQKVFLPFEQSSYAIGKAKDGTGLGLPLARELMVQHGGNISLESTVGVGTTVTVRFPATPPTDPG